MLPEITNTYLHIQIEKMIKGEKDWFDPQLHVDWSNHSRDIK